MAGAVGQALAQESLATAATPTDVRDFAERHVGPIVLTPGGKTVPNCAGNDTTPASDGPVKRAIAAASETTRDRRM